MISEPELIPYVGTAEANTTYANHVVHSAANAFKPEGEAPWASKANEFPAAVWFKFQEAVKLSKVPVFPK